MPVVKFLAFIYFVLISQAESSGKFKSLEIKTRK